MPQNFSVNAPRDWLLSGVLQQRPRSRAGWMFRDGANHAIIKFLEPHLPPQLAMSCASSRISLPSVGSNQSFVKRWYCGARSCPTKLDVFCDIDDPVTKLVIRFTDGPCAHFINEVYGQLRGPAIAQWSEEHLGPHLLQLEGLHSVSSDRFLTGNMQNIPSRSSSQRISSNKRTKLRRDPDLLLSLRKMCLEEQAGGWIRQVTIKPASVLVLSEGIFFIPS